jgi:hypothetical protein
MFFLLPLFLEIRCIVFCEKNLEYKVYGEIVGFFLYNLEVNMIRRDKISIFSYFTTILTSITYLY